MTIKIIKYMRNTTSHNISMKAVVTKQNYDKR